MHTEKAIALLGIVFAGVISMSSSGGHYDFMDMAIGIVLLLMLWPMLNPRKASLRERLLLSCTGGMLVFLITAVWIDYCLYLYPEAALTMMFHTGSDQPKGQPLTVLQDNQAQHALAWALYSLGIYIMQGYRRQRTLQQARLVRKSRNAQRRTQAAAEMTLEDTDMDTTRAAS